MMRRAYARGLPSLETFRVLAELEPFNFADAFDRQLVMNSDANMPERSVAITSPLITLLDAQGMHMRQSIVNWSLLDSDDRTSGRSSGALATLKFLRHKATQC